MTDYRTISLSQMSKGELACTLPWREIVGEANYKRDFLKVVDFVHYLRAEGYDMVTFDKVGNVAKRQNNLNALNLVLN